MKLSGRKVILVTSSILIAFVFPNVALAYSSNISAKSTAEGGSDANVSVNSNITSNNTTTTKNTGRTDIVIECNGVKKEYHSDKAENVNLNCDDDTSGTVKSEVNIKNNTSPTAKVSQNQISEEEKENINDEKKEIKEKVQEAKTKLGEERKDLFEQITQMIRNFFKSFHI